MRNSRLLTFLFLIISLILLTSIDGKGQVNRLAAGFAFSTPTDFNHGETGNPGLAVKTWVNLNKAGSFHFVPSLTAYYRYRNEMGYSVLTNYMFQGDLDFQYTVFHEGTVKLAAFAGANGTYLKSDFELLNEISNETISDTSDFAPGGNLGAALELKMSPKWDFFISAKYIFSAYSQFVISVQGVYYFKSRRRTYRR